MALAAAVHAFGPLAAAVLAIVLAAITGFDQNAALPPMVEARFYGFFLDRYPLFCAALVYGLAAILFAMLGPGPTRAIRRLLGGLVGLGLILGLGLYPTFGGLVLRSAFATGGITFLGHQTMAVAYAAGAAAAAVTFGAALGVGRLLAHRRIAGPGPWRRRLARGAARLFVRYLALWFALAILGLARAVGFGSWPQRPLDGSDALLAVGLTCAAFLPHASLVWRGLRPRLRADAA